jgi:hypothetical protein
VRLAEEARTSIYLCIDDTGGTKESWNVPRRITDVELEDIAGMAVAFETPARYENKFGIADGLAPKRKLNARCVEGGRGGVL